MRKIKNMTTNSSQMELTADNVNKVKSPQYDLRKFSLNRILHNNTGRKSIVLLGSFPDVSSSDEAIVLLEKQAFRESEVNVSNAKDDNVDQQMCYFSHKLAVNVEFINNIYGNYQCTFDGNLNAIKATVIYPATEKHIEKYSICQKYIIAETKELYENVTLPYIEASQFSLEWVYNILEHKQEEDRIVFEDNNPETGFILLPDMKWDGHNAETLYLLALSFKRDIKSVRDLTVEHLPLLRNIRAQTSKTIEQRYGIPGNQLRMYFHYQPSFYHLHVHINPIRNDPPGIWCEKSHMLDTVISNLEMLPHYYKQATLPFVVYDGNKLLEIYEQKINIRKPVKRSADELEDVSEPTKKQLKSQM